MRSAIYPGSFDPLTNGHFDIVERASTLFDRLVIAIGTNRRKEMLFSPQERKELIATTLADAAFDHQHVTIEIFTGTLADYITKNSVNTIVRGLRNHIDMVTETQMAKTNTLINPHCDTIFFMSNHAFISSSIIKEIVTLGGSVVDFVPPHVETALYKKLRQ